MRGEERTSSCSTSAMNAATRGLMPMSTARMRKAAHTLRSVPMRCLETASANHKLTPLMCSATLIFSSARTSGCRRAT
eukprot:7389105-Prymnesium_polylepis.2